MSEQEWRERYYAAMHAMQSAVALMVAHQTGIQNDRVLRAFKDLRVGVNSALSDQGALVSLLTRKGVITDEEYLAAVVEFAEREAAARANKAITMLGLPPGTKFA